MVENTTNFIPFGADLQLGIGSPFYHQLDERYARAMELYPNLLYDLTLSSLEKELFSGALQRLEQHLGLSNYSQTEINNLRRNIWGRGRNDQHREALVFELASLLIINREVKDRYTLDRKLSAIMSLLQEQRNGNGFLSGRYGSLRLATLKVYKATYDNKFSALNYNTIRPEEITNAINEGFAIIGNRRALIEEEKHLYADFYFRAADAYRLLLANTSEHNSTKEGYLREMNRMAGLARENSGRHAGAERIERQGERATRYMNDEYGYSWYNPTVFSRWGFDLQTQYHQKQTTANTNYNYTINPSWPISIPPSSYVTSPDSKVNTTTTTNEFHLIGGITYPLSNYIDIRLGGNLIYSDYNSNSNEAGFNWNSTSFVANNAQYTNSHSYQVTGYGIDLSSNISFIKQGYFGLFFNNLSISPHFRMLTEEANLPAKNKDLASANRNALEYGMGFNFDVSPNRSTSDLFRWKTNLDITFTDDQTRGVESQYSVPVWNAATLQYDLYDIHKTLDQNRHFFNFSGRTEFDFIGKNWLTGINFGLNMRPNYQYDYSMTTDSSYYNYDVLAGLQLGYQDRINLFDTDYNYRLLANLQIGNQFGGGTSSGLGMRSAGLSLVVHPEISRVEFETGVRMDWSAATKTINDITGATGSSHSETESRFSDASVYFKFTYRPRSWSTWLDE